MSQKIILVFISIIFFSSFNLVQAQLQINEIMYDLEGSDEGGEWVEIYNATGETVDFSEYKFFEGGVNHKLVLAEGSPRLEPSQYALIVSNPLKFKTNHPSFNGNVFDSSFTLSNTGESFAVKDKDLKIIDQIVYKSNEGGAGNGRTIAKIDGIWKEGKPTPGAINQIYFSPPAPKPDVVVPIKETLVLKKVKTLNTKITPEVSEILPFNAVTASALESEVIKNNPNHSYLFIIIFIIFVGASAGAVYFIRRNKVSLKVGDDFKILDD